MTPLIDGVMTVAAAIAIVLGGTTGPEAYEWDPATREPVVETVVPEVLPTECGEVYLEWVGNDPTMVGSTGLSSDLRVSVVGTFLWVMFDDPKIETGHVEDYVHSIPLTVGVTTVLVCPQGVSG